MKVIDRSRYRYIGVRVINVGDSIERFYAFECVVNGFKPEVVLVKEARLQYANWGKVFFDEKILESSSCVKGDYEFEKSLDLNERKWRGTERPAQC